MGERSIHSLYLEVDSPTTLLAPPPHVPPVDCLNGFKDGFLTHMRAANTRKLQTPWALRAGTVDASGASGDERLMLLLLGLQFDVQLL